MDGRTFEKWLDEFQVPWARGENLGVWWLTGVTDIRNYSFAVHLDEQYFFIVFRFGEAPISINRNSLTYLLELNDQFTLYKLSLDAEARLYINTHWPSKHLTREMVNFLVLEMIEYIDYLYDNMQEYLEA